MELKEQQIVPGLISVIMTNYNTPEEYLRQAIDSILAQTYSNFEFIIVDDCSTDNSLSVIESYEDKRIRIQKNAQNIGLTKSLNKALAICQGEFIARMDSDDISEPERFEKQVQYLQNHSDVVVCGTWAKHFGDWQKSHTNEYVRREIPSREEYSIYQLFSNDPNLVHPSAMFSKRLMLQYHIKYDDRYIFAQDYRMWISCNQYAKCSIVPEVLLNYRVHDKAISSAKKDIQEDCVFRIIQEQLDKLHLKLTDEMKPYHLMLLTTRKPYDLRIKSWIQTIISANREYRIYNRKILEDLLWKKWAEICYFGLVSEKGIRKKTAVLRSLHIKLYPTLISIRMDRRKRSERGTLTYDTEE